MGKIPFDPLIFIDNKSSFLVSHERVIDILHMNTHFLMIELSYLSDLVWISEFICIIKFHSSDKRQQIDILQLDRRG